MSSSAQGAPVAPAEDKKKGLSRVLGRMKTVLKRSDGSKRLSFAGKPSTTTTGSSAPKATAPTPKSTSAAPELKETTVPAAVETKQTTTTPSVPQPTKISRADIHAERARKFAERYQLHIEPHEWQTLTGEKDAWRIEKPIRMRIHRTCHHCNTIFGANKVCVNCEHPRCTKCPRYPLKKKGEKGKTVMATTGPVEVTKDCKPSGKIVLTMPNHKAGGQPLVRKRPMQRVRRTCHECSSLYLSGSKICAVCSHTRCADCPRDPPKKKKYPDGYPGDEPSSITKRIACHKCDKTFPVLEPSDPLNNQQECRRCKHVRCDMCLIALPRKVVPEPDPEVLKSVEEKLRGLTIRPLTITAVAA